MFYYQCMIQLLQDLSGPTFREFLLFLIQHYKSGGRFDEHWSPIYQFCTPCSINFTLIAKVETFKRDSEYIIRQAGLETLLLNKLPKKKIRTISNRSTSNTTLLIPRYRISMRTMHTIRPIIGLPTFQILFSNWRRLVETNSRHLPIGFRTIWLQQCQIL